MTKSSMDLNDKYISCLAYFSFAQIQHYFPTYEKTSLKNTVKLEKLINVFKCYAKNDVKSSIKNVRLPESNEVLKTFGEKEFLLISVNAIRQLLKAQIILVAGKILIEHNE